MSLKLYERPNGIWHIRGTVQRQRVDESARTRSREEAEAVRAKLEAELFKRAHFGSKAVATFAEAVEGYIMAGGEAEHLDPLLDQFGLKRLSDIAQIDIDRYAAKRTVKPSTLIRQIYTPMTAVLNHAANQGLCEAPRIRKPALRTKRTDYLTPEQADAWIKALPLHLSRIVTFYLATGCRATEALTLDWKDVSPDNRRAVLWETKGGYPRGVDLQERARAALPGRSEGHVFLNSRGEPWHGYDAINLMLKRYRAKDGNAGLAPVHCHLFRHTWATWAYACTRDLTFLMQQGGWRSLTLLGRYTHAASPDLADAVSAHGWEFFGREIHRPKRKRRKSL